MEAVDRGSRRRVLLAATLVVVAAWPAFAQVQVRETVKPVRIVQIYGRDTLEVGELETYRVRVNAPYATAYNWIISDGTEIGGNPIVYRFDEPGRYTIVATATNPKGRSSDTLEVLVMGEWPRPPVSEAKTVEAAPKEKPVSTKAPSVASAAAKSTPSDGAVEGSRSAGLLEGSMGNYTWVIAIYFTRREAEALANSYRAVGYRSFVIIDSGGKGSTVFRVALGRFDSEQQALQAKQEVRSHGVRNPILHAVRGA